MLTVQRTLQKLYYASYILQRNFSTFPPATLENEKLPKFKSKSDFNFYWNCIMRAEEDAMKKTRPWQKLELIPANDRKKLRNSALGECLHKDYVFGKNIDKNELGNLIKSLDEGLDTNESDDVIKYKSIDSLKRIKILNYPFAPMTAAKGFDPVYWREAFAHARIYLLGTHHTTRESILDVQNLMRATLPDIVFVEYCKTRAIEFGGLSWTDEEYDNKLGTFDEFLTKFIDREYHGKKLDDFGWFQRWSLQRQAKKKLDEWKKGRDDEFRAAYEMATEVQGCAGLVLGEPTHAHVEAKEIFNSRRVMDTEQFEKEVKEKVAGKRDRHMTKVMHTMLHRCTMEKLCVSHKNGVITDNLDKPMPTLTNVACKVKFEPVTVVGIVGWKHLAGIERIWSKPEEIYSDK